MVAITSLDVSSNTHGQHVSKTNELVTAINSFTDASGDASYDELTANNLIVTSSAVFTGAKFTGTLSLDGLTNFNLGGIANLEVRGTSTSGLALLSDGSNGLTFGAPSIQDGTISARQLVAGTLGANTLADGGVTSVKIASLGVNANNIAAGAVTSIKLGTNSVTQQKIATDAVTAAKISNNAVTQVKIAAAAVSNVKIKDGAVNVDKIANNSVEMLKIGAKAVGANNLATTLDLSSKSMTMPSAFARTDTSQAWTTNQYSTPVALGTFGDIGSETTLTINLGSGQNFTATFANSVTIGAPSNANTGQTGSMFFTQDGTGSRVLSWHYNWHFPANTAPTMSTAGNSEDRVDYIVKAANVIQAIATLAY